jgi:hypothetical protein
MCCRSWRAAPGGGARHDFGRACRLHLAQGASPRRKGVENRSGIVRSQSGKAFRGARQRKALWGREGRNHRGAAAGAALGQAGGRCCLASDIWGGDGVSEVWPSSRSQRKTKPLGPRAGSPKRVAHRDNERFIGGAVAQVMAYAGSHTKRGCSSLKTEQVGCRGWSDVPGTTCHGASQEVQWFPVA